MPGLNAGAASQIRSIRRDDVPAVKRIADETDLFPSNMLDDMIEPYFNGVEGGPIWIGPDDDGALVGFAFCEQERMTVGTWNVLAIGVLPSHQGRGFGAAMMHHLEQSLASAGQRLLLVETSGLAEFERTRSFYRQLEYVEEARIRDYYEPGDHKIVFTKQLR